MNSKEFRVLTISQGLSSRGGGFLTGDAVSSVGAWKLTLLPVIYMDGVPAPLSSLPPLTKSPFINFHSVRVPQAR